MPDANICSIFTSVHDANIDFSKNNCVVTEILPYLQLHFDNYNEVNPSK